MRNTIWHDGEEHEEKMKNRNTKEASMTARSVHTPCKGAGTDEFWLC